MSTDKLPTGWCAAAFEQVVENHDGARIPVKAEARAQRQGKYPYYGASGIIDHVDEYLFDGDYLLIAEDGANLLSRSTPIAFQAHGRFWVNNHAHVVRPSGDAPLAYLEAFLNSIDLAPHVTGSAQPKLTQKALNRLIVPMAPLEEQRRIGTKLAALSTRSRGAREALDEVPELLEKLRQSILAAAFRGDLTKDWRAKNPDVEPAEKLLQRIRAEHRKQWEEGELASLKAKGKSPGDERWKAKYEEPISANREGLPELPAGWCWASLDELLAESLANGRSVPTDDAGFPVLRLTALRHGQIDLRERKGGAWSAADAAPFLIRKNDFLVSRGNGSLELVGRGGLVAEEPDGVAYPDTLIRIRVHSLLDRSYLARVWSSGLVRNQIERFAKTTAGIFKVSQGNLEAIMIPVPSIHEQQRIATLLDSTLDRVRPLELNLQSQLTHLSSLDRAVLSKAFRGELVPQDPNDEPAAAMLARLKAAPDHPGTPDTPSVSPAKKRGRAPRA